MPALVPVLIVIHVGFALALFVPSLLLPFALRRKTVAANQPRGRFVSLLLTLQSRGTVPLGLALAASGFGLVAAVGVSLLRQPWLLVALAIYAVDLAIAFFIQRPELRRLLGIGGGLDQPAIAARARRQRYLSYVMAGLIGTIGFLMSTKPRLW